MVPLDEEDLPLYCQILKTMNLPIQARVPFQGLKAGLKPNVPNAAPMQSAKPIPCRSGRVPAGISCDTVILITMRNLPLKKLDYWMPVDWYNGGMEHTTLHLLYSRFWHQFLHDLGLVSAPSLITSVQATE